MFSTGWRTFTFIWGELKDEVGDADAATARLGLAGIAIGEDMAVKRIKRRIGGGHIACVIVFSWCPK
jgi:hypothetical protein